MWLRVLPLSPGEWATWSHDQKLQYMKTVVVGKEKQLFTEYDARRFSNLECNTCHGSGAANTAKRAYKATFPTGFDVPPPV
jgi:hypothetical protein